MLHAANKVPALKRQHSISLPTNSVEYKSKGYSTFTNLTFKIYFLYPNRSV